MNTNCQERSDSGNSEFETIPIRFVGRNKHFIYIRDILDQRSTGFEKHHIGYRDNLISKLYKSFDSVDHLRNYEDAYKSTGGIFNLEFSLDGKLLVAACEEQGILLYDASSHKRIKTVNYAHQNCVNCVRFLDQNTFATGSDDHFIKLWDIRNLKSAIRTLHGHSNWVKNIEWSEQENVMVSSAFDGTVYAWNLNDPTENSMLFEKVFLMNGLMRMKLTPDGTKMIISTTSGYIIIIHNLSLLNLATDLRSFKPNLYRLMQASEQCFPVATTYNYLFNPKRKRNRIEFIDDFPNSAEVISSLQIHPYGWCAVSRYLNEQETEEWTVVHDIQDRDEKDYDEAFSNVEEVEEDESDSGTDEPGNQRPTDLWMGYISLDDYTNLRHNASYNAYFQHHPEERNKIIQNLPRMTHFIKEKSVGKGFIKGLSFSSDGRIICSPYDKGVRLLGFSDNCQELSDCVPEKPQQLKTIVQLDNYHNSIVLSCKFSPINYQLVSGCLGSKIKWYQPVL
ncbi:hypothetical protein GWI33_012022 [Rhynchophorus ferrugineus]|uniref:WD repeat-containing protein 55 homolog n=1 Tax=Rhynchophorus ferrugineus TaxID=354439 RepID=A0A834I697_RHYFE|nr:hypothetical protein GWI33_012022 [Rhynchophorus ferrugineus]